MKSKKLLVLIGAFWGMLCLVNADIIIIGPTPDDIERLVGQIGVVLGILIVFIIMAVSLIRWIIKKNKSEE